MSMHEVWSGQDRCSYINNRLVVKVKVFSFYLLYSKL